MEKGCFFFRGKKDECLLHMAASFECKSATLSHINTSLGKTVFSGTLEKMDTAGMRGFSWVLWGGEGVLGIMTFPKREKTKIKIQTPSQLVKMQNPKYLYISTNYCLFDKESN